MYIVMRAGVCWVVPTDQCYPVPRPHMCPSTRGVQLHFLYITSSTESCHHMETGESLMMVLIRSCNVLCPI